jgi:hypothetical protein
MEATVSETVATSTGRFSVHSEAHGPHWVAWLTRDLETRPVRDVVLIGETQKEAESRAQAWSKEAQDLGYV